MRFELMPSSLPRRRSTPELRGRESLKPLEKNWSGRRDSNSRPSAWKADALPTELHPLKNCETAEFRIAKLKSEDKGFRLANQFRNFAIRNLAIPLWCRGQDSNLRRALARRVYSPVPLTARPPLHLFKCLVEPAKGLEPPTL